MEKCIILKWFRLSKKRAKRKDTSDEKFLTAVVNFLIMALIVFCIVKAMNAAGERFGHKEEKKSLTQRNVHTVRAR